MYASSHDYEYGGNSLQQDHAKAMDLWKQAAELGSSVSHFYLGNEYYAIVLTNLQLCGCKCGVGTLAYGTILFMLRKEHLWRVCVLLYYEVGHIGTCAFCKADIIGKTDEEIVEELMKRVEANDACAILLLGNQYAARKRVVAR